MAVRVASLGGAEELVRLGPAWESLLERSASDTIFLTPAWIESWWAAYAAGRELVALRVDGDDALLGLAMLYRREERLIGGMRHRTLALVGDGSGDSDYLDWISAAGRESEVVDTILEHLRRHVRDWDLLILNEIPETSPHLPALEAGARARRWPWQALRVACARVVLPSSWDDYLKMLKPRMRTKVRSLLRDVEETFHGIYDRCETEADLGPRLESLYDLHNRRWDADGKRGVFQGEEKRAFYERLSRRLLAENRLRFYSLRIGDRYVAHQYCFEYRSRMYLLQEGLDPEWFEHGAGNALRAHVFRDCIERGVGVYDFLGGVTSHKLSWGAETVWSVRVTTGPATIKNRLLFGVRDAREAAKRLLRPERGEAPAATEAP